MAEDRAYDEVVILVTPVVGEVREVRISADDWRQFESDVERGQPHSTDVLTRIGSGKVRILRGLTPRRPNLSRAWKVA